jgi:hypothetical protein
MSEQGKRLQLAREHAGYKSGRQAAMRLGWTYPTYAAHESGWRVYPPKVARKYSKAFGVAEEWLLFGKSPPDWYTTAGESLIEISAPVRYLTMFDGQTAEEIEKHLQGGLERSDFCISDLGDIPAGCFAMRVRSSEMAGDGEGAVNPGETLVLQKADQPPPPGSIVLLKVRRQVAPSLRRVKSVSGGRVRYAALSPDYEPLEETDAAVMGRGVLHLRQL